MSNAETDVLRVWLRVLGYLRMGCRQSWNLSGNTEFILFIYSNRTFLVLLLFISLTSRCPLRDIFTDRISSFNAIEYYRFNFYFYIFLTSSTYSSLISPYSGLLSEPDVYAYPTSRRVLFCFNYMRYLMKGDYIN